MMHTYKIVFRNLRTRTDFEIWEQPRACLDSRIFRLIRSVVANEARDDFAKSFELRRVKLCFGSLVEARLFRDDERIGTVVGGVQSDGSAWTDIYANGKIQPVRGWFA